MNGSGAFLSSDGTELAKKGIVLVTFNYRLGPLGNLVHPELEAEAEKAEVMYALEVAGQARAEAGRIKAEAEEAKAEAEKARAEAQKARVEAEKARAEAEKARAEAEKAMAEAKAEKP